MLSYVCRCSYMYLHIHTHEYILRPQLVPPPMRAHANHRINLARNASATRAHRTGQRRPSFVPRARTGKLRRNGKTLDIQPAFIRTVTPAHHSR